MLREKLKQRTCKSKSTDGRHRGGVTRSSDEVSVMEMERRGYIVQVLLGSQPNIWEELLQVSKVVWYFQTGSMESILKGKSK
jgi:hypothetical protein